MAPQPQLMNADERRIIMDQVLSRHAESKFDYGAPDAPDFRAALDKVRNEVRAGKNITKVMNTNIATTDFGETFDIPLEEPDGFWDKVADESSLLNVIPTKFTGRSGLSRNELTLGANGQDIVRPGVEGTDPGFTVTVNTAARVFTPQENIVIVAMTDNAVEDNLEGQGLESHLMGMIASAVANEREKAILNAKEIGTTNSQRGSIDGMYDGIIEQCYTEGGNIVYGATFEDRLVSIIQENNKHLAAAKALPTQYGLDGKVWLSPRTIIADYVEQFGQRQTPLGDAAVQRGYRYDALCQGQPFFECAGLRLDHIVNGSGVVQASSPVDSTLSAIAMSRQAEMTLASVTNEADNNKYVIGCDAAGTSFDLRAEYCIQLGAAVGSVITVDTPAAFLRDHASGDIVTEYSTAPDMDGIVNLLIDIKSNLLLLAHRVMRIETYRLPRTRATAFILTWRECPIVLNPADSVVIRDLLAL